jgi:Cu-Zn family superoxide dismutase
MKLRYLLALLATAVLAVTLKAAAQTKVELKDAQGKDVGTAKIASAKKGVKIALNLHGLPPGQHGIHFHQTAKCDPPDFKSAGGHLNPDGKHHGLENPEGHHAGDMRNITVGEKGTVKTTLTEMDVNLGNDNHSLFSNGGTALVIHAKADDMKTDPAGNSGDRIACGLITK